MIARVLGVQYLDYVSRKTGNPVKGLSLHCAYKDQQVEGEASSFPIILASPLSSYRVIPLTLHSTSAALSVM